MNCIICITKRLSLITLTEFFRIIIIKYLAHEIRVQMEGRNVMPQNLK